MTITLKIDPRSLVYPVRIRPDEYANGDTAYIAEIPDLPGCKAHGRTPEEARAQLEDAKLEYIEALSAEGLEIPAPRSEPSYTWQTVLEGAKSESASTITQAFPAQPNLGGSMLHVERAETAYGAEPATPA